MALMLGIAVAAPAPLALAQDAASTPDASASDTSPDTSPPDAFSGALTSEEALALAMVAPKGRRPSGVSERLATWIDVTNDNGPLPFLIVDKLGARVFAFDAQGAFLGSAPALLGLARGDDSAAGIGDHRKLSEISADQRTTPAGRFVATFGASNGHGRMLWVDLPDAIALHPVMSVNPGEHRQRRIKSQDPSQHRISYGCINVPATFYKGVVLPALAGGPAIVYVLPDTKPLADVFPAFAAQADDGHAGAPTPSPDPLAIALQGLPDARTARINPVTGLPWTQPPAAR